MTFAEKIEAAAQTVYTNSAPFMASKAAICDAIQPVINELLAMPQDVAIAYIRESFSHIGHQALAVRMFKGQPT
tara:strand:+ start:133 stop:354 length:222 start_codon:yes stop_codon:yes gene_type:complete